MPIIFIDPGLEPSSGIAFDVYDVPDAVYPPPPEDPSVFLNGNLFNLKKNDIDMLILR